MTQSNITISGRLLYGNEQGTDCRGTTYTKCLLFALIYTLLYTVYYSYCLPFSLRWFQKGVHV